VTATESSTATARVVAAYDRIAEVDRPEVWITLRPIDELLSEAADVDAAVRRPLSGLLLAVKDNIDVAGVPTTAGCSAYAYLPTADAPAVARLRAAGALVVGKTNLDQFAAGLVGTRSPYGAVRDSLRPEYISGGSSSGSAVAVALELVDLALGTDTAGSGRVPAAFQGVVGIKPTRGLVPVSGVVPACRTLDCVSVFSRDLATGDRGLWVMAGADPGRGPAAALSRSWPGDAPLAAGPAPRIAVPASDQLSVLSPEGRHAFAMACARITELGAEVREIDLEPFLAAGRLLYGGAFVAERHAAVGAFIAKQPDGVDPSVRQIITAAGELSASRLVADGEQLDTLRLAATRALGRADTLLVPTAPRHPTMLEVEREPIAVNAELGRFTSFANLLDMCAIAVPASQADGGHFGVTFLAPAFADRRLAVLAACFLDEEELAPGRLGAAFVPGPVGIELLVIGAHRRGQPLNHQLTDRGARFLGVVHTSAQYRMHALPSEPPKPALVRVSAGGASIEGELWELPRGHLGPFQAALPRPMAVGKVTLASGREVVGFLCEPAGLAGAPDITAARSWPNHLAGLS
jgi:allophanate hydrolase